MKDVPTLSDLQRTRDRLRERLHLTPLLRTSSIGAEIGAELWLKCENLQKTGSFKPRGVLSQLDTLGEDERSRGVVTISAGNYAQALAWGATQSGVAATVVMPAKASPTKATATRAYGAEVILHGTSAEAFQKARDVAHERDLTFLHPFDDPALVAGTASLGLEIVEQLPEVSVVAVPIGGGGLIAGILAALSHVAPGVKVYGVEPTGAAAMRASLDAGHPVHLDAVSSIADGLAPPMAGDITYEYVSRYAADVVLVTDDEIRAAMPWIYGRAKLVAEPSGAAGVAALLAGKIPLRPDDRVVALLSGGNVELDRLTDLLAPVS